MSEPRGRHIPPPELRALLVSSPEFANLVLPGTYADAANWSALQRGYRVHGLSGESLVSDRAGEWHPDWWVFATNYFADPFFVDLRDADAGFPVRFASAGAGRWTPILVADSVSEFSGWLEHIAALESEPHTAGRYVEMELPDNEFWEEVAATYREDDE
ncbi:hypothetical protein [Microbacterium gorillae]|uniref:hypothetical protein n=1 Tax=Microbacterium gorillae TaxID=1231063 RepID=UPI003D97E6C0